MTRTIEVKTCDEALVGMIAIREYVTRKAATLAITQRRAADRMGDQFADAARELATTEDAASRSEHPGFPDVAS